ncbi:MAG TPA: hypothetical protein PKE12_15590 [Kiritimatiellia bacterium]|nr:hypothetical protein [Kiritimatiellia bacterium]
MHIRVMSVVLAVVSFVAARADVLVVWENDHLAGNEASTIAGEAPSAGSWNVQLAAAPVLSRGPGGTATQYTNTFGMRNANAQSLADAIASNRYLTFTLTAQGGKAMNLTNIFARLQAQNATAYPVSFALMSDATGFGVGDEITIWTVGGTGNANDWLGQQRTFNLSGIPALQGVSEVEFRIYIHGQQGGEFTQVGIGRAFQTNGSADLRVEGEIVDDVQPPSEIAIQSFSVNGTQAVLSWEAPPAGYLATIWWMPDVGADLVDQVLLATGVPDTQQSYTDAVLNAQSRGFYRVEANEE